MNQQEWDKDPAFDKWLQERLIEARQAQDEEQLQQDMAATSMNEVLEELLEESC
jgi:hypothetical protein